MLNIISAELMKYKRGKILLFCFMAIVLYIACIIIALPPTKNFQVVSYLWLFYDSFPFFFLIHITVLGLLASIAFSNEYRNNTIRQLILIPVSAKQFFLSKFAIIVICSIILTLCYSISITLIAIIVKSIELTFFNIGMIFILTTINAITISIALIPILFIMVLSKQNYIFSMFAAFFYTIISLFLSMGMIQVKNDFISYLFPLGNVAVIHNTIVYNLFSSVLWVTMPSSENPYWCFACLCIYALVFSILSIAVLNRQNH